MNRNERRRLKKVRRPGDLSSSSATLDVRATQHRAFSLLRAGRPRDALELYQKILKIYPDDIDALNLSSIATFQLGNVQQALKLIRKALVVQPDHVDAHNNLGNLLKASNLLDEAETAYRCAIEIKPDYVGGHFNLGIVLEMLERLDEAETAYRHALAFKPDLLEACLNLGNVLKALGRLDEAIGAYQRALELAHDHADAHNNLGSALREMGRLDEAEVAYRRALDIEPQHQDAHYNLGIVMQEQGKLDDAVAAYRRALECNPSMAGAWVNLGYALQSSGKLDEAISSYRRAIEITPGYPGAHVNLGDALLEIGDVKAARKACEAYLEEYPNDTSLLAWKAIVLRELGEREASCNLVNFDRFIQQVRINAPAPYSSLAEFNTALAEHVRQHPSLVYAPSRHATRFGKHSGELLTEPKGPIAYLEGAICAAVEAYVVSLRANPEHPFVNSTPRHFGLTAWSIVLEGQGYQVPHIHPSAWLSGVYYVQLPELAGQSGQGDAGWIEFGRPPEHFHCSVEPEVRAIQPEPGLMLLFPSYFYHRTVPFKSAGLRISISFDVLPQVRTTGRRRPLGTPM